MKCPHCSEEMDYRDGEHRWNIRIHYCSECDYEEEEDITGDLIDHAKERSGV